MAYLAPAQGLSVRPLAGQTGVNVGGPEHDAGDEEEQYESEAGERAERCGPGYDGRGQERTVDRTRVVGPRPARTVLCGAAVREGDAGHLSRIAGTTANRTTKDTRLQQSADRAPRPTSAVPSARPSRASTGSTRTSGRRGSCGTASCPCSPTEVCATGGDLPARRPLRDRRHRGGQPEADPARAPDRRGGHGRHLRRAGTATVGVREAVVTQIDTHAETDQAGTGSSTCLIWCFGCRGGGI